jgi:hypothetical protein
VALFVALNRHDTIGFVKDEVDSCKFLGTLPTVLDDGLSIGGVASGSEELVESFFLSLPPLVCSLRMIPLEMHPQILCIHESGTAALGGTGVREIIVVEHLVVLQTLRLDKCSPTVRDSAFVRPFTRV